MSSIKPARRCRSRSAARYRELGVNAEAQAFIQDMAQAYEWADLAICRAGAMTISELAATGCPAILVPLPWAIDDHQVANAHYLADAGAGVILLQKDLTPESLAEAVTDVREQLAAMAAAAKQCARLDATEVVAQLLYCRGKLMNHTEYQWAGRRYSAISSGFISSASAAPA